MMSGQTSGMIAAGMPQPAKPVLMHRLLRWMAIGVVILIALLAFAFLNNNFSLTHRSRAAFNAQVDADLDHAIGWIAAHPDVSGTNPPLMYMVADIEKMTGDPRLRSVLEANKQTLNHRYAASKLTPFWMRFADPHTPLPFMTSYDLSREGSEQRWFAYAIDPNRAHLSE